MRIRFPKVRTLWIVVFLLFSYSLFAAPQDKELTAQIQHVISELNKFTAKDFDPCQSDSLKHQTSCKVDERILWSGFDPPPGSKDFAPNHYSLNDTPAGQYVDKKVTEINTKFNLPNNGFPMVKPIWEAVSAAYIKFLPTRQAQVTVYIGSDHREGSVFCKVELPLLLKTHRNIVLHTTPALKEYNELSVTAQNQWPCGTAKNLAKKTSQDKEARQDKKTKNQADYFAKTVAAITLADPVKAWKGLLSSIQSNPILSKIDLSKVVHIGSNQFNFKSSTTLAGKLLSFQGSLFFNPQAEAEELYVRLVATLQSGNIKIGGLETTAATLDMAIANVAGQKEIFVKITPDFKVKSKKFPMTINMVKSSQDKSVAYDFELGDAISLAELVPVISRFAIFNATTIKEIKLHDKHFDIAGEFEKKPLQVSFAADAAISITAQGIVAGDLFSQLKSIDALNAVAVDKISVSKDTIEVEIKLQQQTVALVSHLDKDKKKNYLALYFGKLNAASIIPAAKGHLVNELELDRALFVFLPRDATPHSMSADALPGQLARLAGLSGQEQLELRPGLNIAAMVNLSRSKSLASIFKTLGINSKQLPLRGGLPGAAFFSSSGKSGTASKLLAGLNLNINLPAPKLAAVSNFVSVTSPAKLHIGSVSLNNDSLWSRVPASLNKLKPTDDLGMSLQFSVALKNIEIKEKIDALIDIGSGDSQHLSLLVLTQQPWQNPFGIKELTLGRGGFQFALQHSRAGAKESLAFFGTANLGKYPEVAVSADFSQQKGKLTLNYFELDGKFNLKDVPGGQHIPHAEKYELDKIKLSTHGVEAKAIVSGKQVDTFLFELANNNWVFAIDQKNFKFRELLPAIKKIKHLDSINLSKAALIISKNGITGSYTSLPVIAQDLMRDIFGNAPVDLNIPGGIGLLAAFDEKEMGVIGKGLKKIGVHDDAVLMGAVTGVFQGTPGIQLALMMQKPGPAHGLPNKVMSVPKGVAPSFFIQWSGAEFYVGAGVGLHVKAGRDTLLLDSKMELEFSEKGIGIDILGSMKGVWKNPFGIKKLQIADLTMKVGINDIGEVLIGFAGKEKVANETIELATEVKILLEDALPDGVAFSGSVSNLGVPAMIEIAESLMGSKGKIPASKMPFFEIHDALLAFATPGASDPQLGLVSGGFAVKGKFYFMSRELGMISGNGSARTGLTFQGKIDDIVLEVLALKNNNLDMAINLQPKFILSSNIKLLKAQQGVTVDFSPPHFEFDVDENLGHFGDAHLRVRIDGVDLKKGTYFKNSDISVIGQFKSTLIPWMQTEIKNGISELRQSANARLKANLKALQLAQTKVDSINKKIRKLRSQDDRSKQRDKNKLHNAEKRVAILRQEYQHAQSESKQCGTRWTHWSCSGYWRLKAASLYESYRTAEDILEIVKAAEAAAFDLDPRIIALITERDAAHSELAIAQGVIKAAKDAQNFVLKDLERTLNSGLKKIPFEIEQAIIIGDLRDMLKHHAPLILDMKFKLFGEAKRIYFALKINDPAFDAVSFALLPAMAMDKLTEKALKKVDPKVANWVHSHIATKLLKAEAMVRNQVQAEEKKYASVLASFDKGGAKFEAAHELHTLQQIEHVKRISLTDLFEDSQLFKNTYLAVGHSRLCLGVANNNIDVIQENCRDIEADRWSTEPLEDGYIELRNKGLCLKARSLNATGAAPLILSQCTKQYLPGQWKVISSDGFYSKIVNRYSQKCLHFDKESANPKSATAVWTSCFGADSQTFRDLKDAERPTWHGVKSMLEAKNGRCLSLKGNPSMATLTRPSSKLITKAVITHQQYLILNRVDGNGLYAEDCNPEEDKFNFLEEVNGDIKLIHDITGWCVHPRSARENRLALSPCDRGDDMLWRLKQVSGKAWMLLNVQHNACLNLPRNKTGAATYAPANLSSCKQGTAQLFDFIKR